MRTRIVTALIVLLCLVGAVGELKCIVKMLNCDWEPVGKAEIIYTGGVFTGLGCVVGYLDIEDN